VRHPFAGRAYRWRMTRRGSLLLLVALDGDREGLDPIRIVAYNAKLYKYR
jgi:hypothetical protein